MSNTLTYKGGGVIQIMNTSDLNALSQQVLEFMASNNGPGAIYNASGTGNVLIGTFTDTRYSGNVGEGNVTVLSSTSDLYQDLSTPTGTEPPRPLRYTSSSSPMQSMSDAQVNTLADSILQYCILSEGPFSYQLANTTPSDGGTWTSVGQFNDTSNTTTVFYLWKKINSGSYTITRPLRSLGNGTIQAFTNTEITQLSKKVRERIVNTGVGQYLLQSSTPTPGTWVSKGSVTDTRPTISDANYDGSIEVGYTTDTYTGFASFSGFTTFGGFVPANYTGPAFQTFTGPGPATYTGQGNFGGFVPADYTGPAFQTFTGPGPATYTGQGNFGGFVPAAYEGPSNDYFVGPGPATYTGQGNFGGFVPTNYLGPGNQYFTGPGPATYTGATIFGGFTPANYIGPAFQQFTGPSPTTYVGPGFFSGFTPTNYIGPAFQQFVGPGPITYTGSTLFSSPPTVYTLSQFVYYQIEITPNYNNENAGGPFAATPVGYLVSPLFWTGPGTVYYTGSYTGNPSVPTYYNTEFSTIAPVYYTGAAFYEGQSFYSGPVVYTGNFLRGYNTLVSSYFTGPGINYTGDYFAGTGPTTYQSNPDTTPFTGPSPTNFAGFQNFTGFVPTTYQSNPDSTPFTGPSPISYTGNYFAGTTPTSYISSNPDLTPFTGPSPATYVGFQNFSGTTPTSYTAPGTVPFFGPSPVTYVGFQNFSGTTPTSYQSNPDTTPFTGPSPATYVGFQNFSGTTPTSYQSNPDTTPFTGPSPVTYTGPAAYLSSADYVSLITYTGTVGAIYTGSVINDDRSTISTLTLWRRVA